MINWRTICAVSSNDNFSKAESGSLQKFLNINFLNASEIMLYLAALFGPADDNRKDGYFLIFASWKEPSLKALTRPLEKRVPSGNMKMELPSFKCMFHIPAAFFQRFLVARFSLINNGWESYSEPISGTRNNSILDTHLKWKKSRKPNQNIQLRTVVGHNHICRIFPNILGPSMRSARPASSSV